MGTWGDDRGRRRRLGGALLVALGLVALSCGAQDDPKAGDRGPVTTAASAATLRAPGTTTPTVAIAPDTEAPTTATTAPASTSSSVSPSSQTTVITQPPVTSPTSLAAGTSDDAKAWCAKAKPVSASLLQLYSLTPAQLETLITQANELKPAAPANVQAQLAVLADVGGRFLAAVKAGTATITAEGVAKWAAANLTAAEQQSFLLASGDVTSYINRTC